jgi:hypothetical protein
VHFLQVEPVVRHLHHRSEPSPFGSGLVAPVHASQRINAEMAAQTARSQGGNVPLAASTHELSDRASVMEAPHRHEEGRGLATPSFEGRDPRRC